MNGNAGHRQVVVADGKHPHDGKHPAQVVQLGLGAHADRAVHFDLQPRRGICVGRESRLVAQRSRVDFGDQVKQGAVLRHFVAVHGGHCGGKLRANAVGGHESPRLGRSGAIVQENLGHSSAALTRLVGLHEFWCVRQRLANDIPVLYHSEKE